MFQSAVRVLSENRGSCTKNWGHLRKKATANYSWNNSNGKRGSELGVSESVSGPRVESYRERKESESKGELDFRTKHVWVLS